MVVGEKKRENKFSEKIRKNFEKFKEKIEKIGEKAIVLGAIGGVALGGCVSRETIAWNRVFARDEEYSPLTKIVYSRLYDAEIEVTRMKIYHGCKTRKDSIEATRRVWMEKTGSANPRDWEKAVEKARKRKDIEGLSKFGLLMFATYPYSTMLGFYDSVYKVFEEYEQYKDLGYKRIPNALLTEIYTFLYAAEIEVTRMEIYRGCKTREDSIEATRRVWIERTGSANPRHWEKAVEDASKREDIEALGKFNLLIFATYPYSAILGFHDPLYELLFEILGSQSPLSDELYEPLYELFDLFKKYKK